MSLLTSLISYWPLDEASGDALDAHGSHDLTESGGTIGAASGIIGTARDFEEGDTEWFQIADNADLSTGNVDFTLCGWVNAEALSTNNTLASKFSTTGNQREYSLGYNATFNVFRFTISTDGTSGGIVQCPATVFGAPSNATWYFVLAWHDATANTLNIQINNSTPESVSHSGGVFDGTSPFAIGARINTTGEYWDGLIQFVGFWKRVLTSDERTTLYNSGTPLTYAQLAPAGDLLLRMMTEGLFAGGAL